MESHKELRVWKEAIGLITDIYQITRGFPKEELYGLTQQARRAAISIGSNIAEGAARGGTKEYIRFLSIALGSQAELELQLIVARNLNFLDDDSFYSLNERNKSIGRMIVRLIQSLKKKLNRE